MKIDFKPSQMHLVLRRATVRGEPVIHAYLGLANAFGDTAERAVGEDFETEDEAVGVACDLAVRWYPQARLHGRYAVVDYKPLPRSNDNGF